MNDSELLLTTVGRVTLIATALTAVSTGLMSGVFYSFSTSVMRALAKLPAPQGIAAMQAMNVSIVNPLFLLVLVGSTISCVALLVTAPFSGAPHPGLRIAGTVVYLVGAIGVTAVVNVPMNNALAATDPASATGAALWRDYLSRWTRFNHLRALASVGATTLLALALLPPGR
ncbi:MAG: anthrone oxygenase family protein [Propionibacteriaceae bacterium]